MKCKAQWSEWLTCAVDVFKVLQAFAADALFLTPLEDEADSFFFRGYRNEIYNTWKTQRSLRDLQSLSSKSVHMSAILEFLVIQLQLRSAYTKLHKTACQLFAMFKIK